MFMAQRSALVYVQIIKFVTDFDDLRDLAPLGSMIENFFLFNTQ